MKPFWLVCVWLGVGPIVPAAPAQTSEVVLHSFAYARRGANPRSGLVRDPSGNFYGTTSSGGPGNHGLVYRLSPSGRQTVLYTFSGGADGSNPAGGVIRDAAGNLYGTTSSGGAANAGVIYRVDSTGHETVLYSFTGGVDGSAPNAGVIRDSIGNLYGTTYSGGTANAGVVFKFDIAGNETVRHSFAGWPSDGANPAAGVILDSAGNLYGTTVSGGASNWGVVYRINPSGQESLIYTFSGGTDGGLPFAGVIRDSQGNLYGTASGLGSAGAGVVYKLNLNGALTVLHSFTGGQDGGSPVSGVAADASGNLYGTTEAGGTAGAGTIYQLDRSGRQSVLYTFQGGLDGRTPVSGVLRDTAGNLFGTTSLGGSSGAGAVYKLSPGGSESVLFSFPGGPDGQSPYGTLTADAAGNLYGTTVYGGSRGAGAVFKLDAAGHESILYSFTGSADGGNPHAGVTLDAGGNIFGTAQNGGTGNHGVVYKLDTAGRQTVLYSFSGGGDGAFPSSTVTLDSAGNLYGTTVEGGALNAGVVFKIDTSGAESTLYSFQGTDKNDGANPEAGVLIDANGNLFGTTYNGGTGLLGVVYKIDSSGHETVLYNFTGFDGARPAAGVVMDAASTLYGTTTAGGAAGAGAVYRLDASGQQTVLHSFAGPDGSDPLGGVVLGAAGQLYGTTNLGGPSGAGTVFRLGSNGQIALLHSFTGGSDGGYPVAGLYLNASGRLFGSTSLGGVNGAGAVFQIK